MHADALARGARSDGCFVASRAIRARSTTTSRAHARTRAALTVVVKANATTPTLGHGCSSSCACARAHDARAVTCGRALCARVGCARCGRARCACGGARRAVATRATPATARASDAAAAPPSVFLTGIAWFFAHQLIGVGNDVIMKFTGANLGVAQVVFLRFLFATLTMVPVMVAGGKESWQTDRVPLHIARSALLAGGIFLYVKGLTIAPIAVVTTLNFTIPLFTLVLARVFLNEAVDATRWIGTLVGFLGVMVVMQPGGQVFNPMWLVVLLSATMFASLDVLNKVFVGKESFWAMIFYTALFTTCITAYPALTSWVAPTMSQYGLLALLGAGANGLLYCLLKSFSMVDASALAPFRYTELMFSATVGFLLFGEIPASSTLLGALIIIPSTLYVVWKENQKSSD